MAKRKSFFGKEEDDDDRPKVDPEHTVVVNDDYRAPDEPAPEERKHKAARATAPAYKPEEDAPMAEQTAVAKRDKLAPSGDKHHHKKWDKFRKGI